MMSFRKKSTLGPSSKLQFYVIKAHEQNDQGR